MWPFKKKKKKNVYKVEFRDAWDEYGCTLVMAVNASEAWSAAKRQFSNFSPFRPIVCLRVTEIEKEET